MRFDRNRIADVTLGASALVTGLAVAAIFGFLFLFALPVFTGGQGLSILSGVWNPGRGQFGILPMLAASLCVALSALALGWPLALGLCCGIRGFLPRPVGRLLLMLLRGMTAFPTVVYGFAAIFLLVPIMREGLGRGSGLSWATAGLVLSLVILPTMALVMDAGMRQTERRLRLTGAALGFTREQTLTHLVLPACRKNLLAAAALGFGRAIGDTLIPLMLAGNAPQWPSAAWDSIRTLTAHIGLVLATDSNSAAYGSVFVAGCLLLLVNVTVQLCLRSLLRTGETA
jgi:phosphate transport system permease protein